MCLAIPGKITRVNESEPMFRTGWVDFGGVSREVNLAFVPEARLGDWVLVHVGFALNVVDEEEARKIFADLQTLSEVSDSQPKNL